MGFVSLLFLFILFFLVCATLIFIILLQKGKGEGLAGLMGGVAASDGMGTPEAQKELSRWTGYLSGFFFAMCLLLTIVSSRCAGPREVQPISGAVAPEIPEVDRLIAEALASPEEQASPEPIVETPLSPEAAETAEPVTPEAAAPAPVDFATPETPPEEPAPTSPEA